MSRKNPIDRLFSSGVSGRLLGYVWRYRKYLPLAIIGMVLFSATNIGLAALVKPLLDGSFAEGQRQAYSGWIPAAFFFVLLARAVGNFMSVYYMECVSNWVGKNLRSEMFARLLKLPTSYFDRTTHGTIISKLTFSVEKTLTVSAQTFTYLIRDTLTIVGLVAWLFYLHWEFSLVLVILFPLIGWLTILASRRLRKVSRRIQAAMGDVTDDIQQAIQGNLAIKVFGSQHSERANFERSNEKNRKQRMSLLAVKALNTPVAGFLAGVGFALVLLLALREGVSEATSPGTLASFAAAALLLMRPIRNFARLNGVLQDGLAAAESVFGFIDEPIEPAEKKTGKLKCDGNLRFRGVSMKYPGSDKYALESIDCRIAAGETVALVGRSGSGKSTFTKLIPRLYEPERGSIELDGTDIAGIPLADLREQIAYVPQCTTLSNATVACNITCGKDYEVQDVITAARKAHALEFIECLPEGFDTALRNNGSVFSEGQKQRVSIARALLKNAPILIFDEATSSLDVDSERHIQAALEEVMKDRTVIIIAHRLSTIRKVDRIIVLEEGRIAEQGTHRELSELNGIYAGFCRRHDPRELIA